MAPNAMAPERDGLNRDDVDRGADHAEVNRHDVNRAEREEQEHRAVK